LEGRPGLFRVFLGRTDMTSNKAVVRNVKRIFVHPRYNPSSLNRDAAVLKLSREVRDIPKLKLAEVTSRNWLEKPGSTAVVAGWGSTLQKSFTTSKCSVGREYFPDRMREARVPIRSDSYAAYVYNEFLPYYGYHCRRYVSKKMIAADRGGKGTCQSDSGGPLIKLVQRNGKKVHIQIGIVSGGVGCAYDGYPGKYSEVNSKQIAPFIKSAARR
jgi:secreted trypsin-like serine protease